jgi:predicted translin family RNA/ssDNA-binding protein
MDEYAKEISDLTAQIDAMIEEEADKKEIAELQMQLGILRTLYQQAMHLLESGRANPELRESLALRGYGEWTLDNVYAFVYETSVDLPADGHHSFLGEIRDTDFSRLLTGSPAV